VTDGRPTVEVRFRRLPEARDLPPPEQATADSAGSERPSDRVSRSDSWSSRIASKTRSSLARACSLVGTFKPAKGAAVIAAEILDGVFLSGVGVRHDVQNQRPLPYARALSEAACGALVKLGGEDARAALQRMRKAGEGASGTSSKSIHRLVAIMGDWARDPAIAGHVAEALSHLDG